MEEPSARANINAGDHPADLFAFLHDAAERGLRSAIVTLVDVVKTASRAVGAHMAVCESGEYAGSISSGCVDASVANMAAQAIANRRGDRFQIGAGSPFVDLKLPCGGGVDLLVTPIEEPQIVSSALALLKRRRPAALSFSKESIKLIDAASARTGWRDDVFVRRYEPKLRLVLAGRGDELTRFCEVALACRYMVQILAPDMSDVDYCKSLGASALRLPGAAAPVTLTADEWSAIVLLFHDHDWERAILLAALATDAFYIGALGSRKTHAARRETLQAAGTTIEAINRIVGPIGLIPSMRDPSMLAISALAEIINRFSKRFEK